MPFVFDATAGGASANSFLTEEEFETYVDSRLEVPELDNVDSIEALLVMATRYLTVKYSPTRKLIRMTPPAQSYYLVSPTWTGLVSTTTQALPWPRIGMFDRNGNAIPTNVVPIDLKNATAELALHLAKNDPSFDSEAVNQGIASLKAGSVAISFRDGHTDAIKIIPDIVFDMLVPSWLTDEIMEYSLNEAMFDVVS